MVSRTASLKKFIKTVVNQLPSYINQYQSDDQKLLNKFIAILQKCESQPDRARSLLIDELLSFYQNIRGSDIYYNTAFLWFLDSYIENANLLLSVADFHAEDYYAYLAKHLRTNSDLKGAFQLIKEQVALTDLRWELLQYACVEPPELTLKEYDILNIIIRLIEKEGIRSLNPSFIRSKIQQETSSNISKRLDRFLNPIQAEWVLWFNTQAFGIEEYKFRISLTGYDSFSQIFDFNDPMNTTLCRSPINADRNSPKTYIGIFKVPDHLEHEFLKFLQNHETNGNISIHEYDRITDKKISTSYNLYKVNSGWRNIKTSEWRRIKNSYTNNYNSEDKLTTPSFFLSPPFNPHWNFRKHTNAERAIEIYGNIPDTFSFNTLPFGVVHSSHLPFTIREKAHLKELYNNHVVNVYFQAIRLQNSFSLDYYDIQFPKIPLECLKDLLSYLPFCNLYFSESYLSIWARLTPDIASSISHNLNAKITSLIPINAPQPRTSDYFSFQDLKWNNPKIIDKKKERD
jgi:hypothetical protein